MTAGTVVITGGILATVILLSIIAVLCYCRLQYYCCKQNASDSGSLSLSISQPGCSMEGGGFTPLSLSPSVLSDPSIPPSARLHGYCPSCSPYDSPFYVHDDVRNGGERVATLYENRALAAPLREPRHDGYANSYANSHAISTQV